MTRQQGPPPGYVEVSERIVEFREKHPDGTLQSEVIPSPVEGFVIVKAYAYRTPDDPRPGTGLAWEVVPGPTQFTKDSELQNAETSAWGRALIAMGAADAKRGIASANEVRGRSESQSPAQTASAPSSAPFEPATTEQIDEIASLHGRLPDERKQAFMGWIASDFDADDFSSLSTRDADTAIGKLRAAVGEGT